MPATTWRLTGLTLPQGQDLRITGVQLWAGDTDVTALATVSSSFAPSEGALSALTDGDAATACAWAAQQVYLPGFYIEWTFATAVEITLVFLGTSVYAGVLTGGASVINAIGVVTEGVTLGTKPWLAKKAIELGAAGFWSLTESGTSQPDEVAGVRNATRTGGVVLEAPLTSDGVLAFDPQGTGYIRVPNIGALDADAFSVVFDMLSTAISNLVIAEHGDDNFGWSVHVGDSANGSLTGAPAGCLQVVVGGLATGAYYQTRTRITDGTAHRIAITFSRESRIKIYIDGKPAQFREHSVGRALPTYNRAYVDVGSRAGIFGLPTGSRLANFALFSTELTPADVAQLSGLGQWPTQTVSPKAALVAGQAHWLAQGEVTTQLHHAAVLDTEHWGTGCIYGPVELYALAGNIPLPRRVRLHRSRDGLLVRETWSNAQGEYRFDGITDRYKYDVIAWDHEGLQQSVVANDLTPEVMP